MRTAALLAIWLFLGPLLGHAQPAASLEVTTDRKFYRERTTNDVILSVRMSAISGPAGGPAVPRNIAFVLDRSGSMATEPIAALRSATIAAVKRLAPQDFVSVVAFGSEVETIVEAQRRDQLVDAEKRIAQIEPAGGAALFDGINQGAAQLRRNAGPQTLNQLLLVTDGPPTKGPREAADFVRLAEVFAREGILVSTIGLGPDFDEDMLAAMARTAGGRFRYAATPLDLLKLVPTEVASPPSGPVIGGAPVLAFADSPSSVLARQRNSIAPSSAEPAHAAAFGPILRDVVLTITFKSSVRKVRTYDWRLPTINETTVTYRLPAIDADRPLAVLAAAELDGFDARHELPEFARVRAQWRDPATGETREVSRTVALQFSADIRDVRESENTGAMIAAVDATLREGLQDAIEQLDKNNPRAVLRALRAKRSEARDLNFDLEDRQIAARLRLFDNYLAELQNRTPGPADRKILRSGLLHQFDPPAAAVLPKD